VVVRDEREGEELLLRVQPSEALEGYHHPFAYAARTAQLVTVAA
jgi:hypothetical protein